MPYLDLIAFVLLLGAAAAIWCGRARWSFALIIVSLLGALGSVWLLRWQAAAPAGVALFALAASFSIRRMNLRWRRIAALVLGALSVAATLPYLLFPVFDLPTPDGPYQVGARTIDMRDDTRRGVMYTAADAPRRFPATIWYPAAAGTKGRTHPYFTRREALDEGISTARLWGFPSFLFLSLHSTGTHAIEAAPVATGQRFPVIIFNHGYWSHRAQNTALMERLASHGYIVVSIAHPRDGAAVRLADGTLIPTALHEEAPIGIANPAADKLFEEATAAFMGGETHTRRIAALPAYSKAVAAHRLGESLVAWRDDALFTARSLRAEPPAAIADIVAQADFSRTVYAGMSFGGSTAPSACDADPDCAAAVDLDGENFDGNQFDREHRAPMLLMLTDQPFTSAQPADAGVNPTDYAWERWHCIGDRSDILRLRARGVLHMGLTDLPLSARGPFKRNHFTSLDGAYALSMVNDTVLAFLDAHVRGKTSTRLASTLARYPELERLDTRSLRRYAARLPHRPPCPGRDSVR